jgi:XTP/dITP diphosphohydrolase
MSDASRPAVVVATSNPGKLREIRDILGAVPVELIALAPCVRLPEEGDDYEANARAKARAAAAASGRPALADDSGLEVRGLSGAPGPHSARYGGPALDDAGRVAHLLEASCALSGRAREARFVCVAALATPEGTLLTARGECSGRLRERPAGVGGFGYDPVFEVGGDGRTMAQLTAPEKNRISHRARALRALQRLLQEATGPRGLGGA